MQLNNEAHKLTQQIVWHINPKSMQAHNKIDRDKTQIKSETQQHIKFRCQNLINKKNESRKKISKNEIHTQLHE